MDGITMAAYSLAIGTLITVLALVLSSELTKKTTKRQEQSSPAQSPAPLNPLAHSEINAILARHDGREEQLL